MKYSTAILAALPALAAAKDGRTFAVLRFFGDGPMMEGRVDPIVNPGVASTHVHTIMGGSNMGISATGESMMQSSCSNALIVGDNSAYWVPKLYFHDKAANTFEPVEMFYMNVYYFFEGTNDKIEAFPVGLQMVSGNAALRTCPNANGTLVLDPSKGTIQPTQWTCPRSNFNPPSWPAGSDGSKAGIQDPRNQGSGQGFPFAECDGYASPLRQDLHFPSCYNPAAGLTDYKNNMAFPTDAGNGHQDCPKGWIHVPHLFYEMYWNTPKFIDRWTPNQGSQPFVLANGDLTGCSAHGDFLAAWDMATLQNIIDNCDAGDRGMDRCSGVQVRDKSKTCNVKSPIAENIVGDLPSLPGNNPLAGWGVGDTSNSGSTGGSSAAPAPAPVVSSSAAAVKSATSAESHNTKTTTTVPEKQQNPAPTSISTADDDDSSAVATANPTPTTTAPPKLDGSGSSGSGKVVTQTFWDTTWITLTTTIYEDTGATPTAKTAAAASSSSSSAPSKSDVAGWPYAGCFKDTSSRVILGEKFPKLDGTTNEKCVTYCQRKGYTLSGTENGGQCFCGNALEASSEKLDESSCSMGCEADSRDICGGSWALSVYSSNSTAVSLRKREELGGRGAHGHLFRHRSHRRGRF